MIVQSPKRGLFYERKAVYTPPDRFESTGINFWDNERIKIRSEISDGVFRNPRIDAVTNALEGINFGHHEVHEGRHFYCEGSVTLGNLATHYIKIVVPDSVRWAHFLVSVGASGILTLTVDEDATGGMAGGLISAIHANNRNLFCWSGLHDGAPAASALTDTTQAWTTDELVGFRVFNTSDGSSGIITANTATVVTATLAGGAANTWAVGNAYEINRTGLVFTNGVTVNTGFTQQVVDTKFGSKAVGGSLDHEDELMLKQNTTYLVAMTSGAAGNIIPYKFLWYEHTSRD